ESRAPAAEPACTLVWRSSGRQIARQSSSTRATAPGGHTLPENEPRWKEQVFADVLAKRPELCHRCLHGLARLRVVGVRLLRLPQACDELVDVVPDETVAFFRRSGHEQSLQTS